MKILNKVVSVLVIFSFITALLMPIKDAEAQVDAIGGPFQIFSTVYNEAKQIGLDTILKQAAISMANNLLNQMIDSTANWVAGGFDGKPLFVQNPKQFFGNVAMSSANEFVGRLQNGTFLGSKEWLKKVAKDADIKCTADTSPGGQTVQNQYLDYLYGLLNPGMVGDFATGQENVSASAIRTFFDNNKPLTAQEIMQFASQNNFNNLDEADIKMISSFEGAAATSKNACDCSADGEARLVAQEEFDSYTSEQLADFLTKQGANVTLQSYLDEKWSFKSCVDFQAEDGNKPDFIAAGGYTRGIIQFLGQTYSDPKGTIASLAPNYQGLPKEVQKQVSQNWTKFASPTGTFSAGGWNSWNQYAIPNNNPLASKFLFQNAVKQQAASEVKTFKDELKDGGGFLGAKKCLVKEVELPTGEKKCPTDQLATTTPGQIVGDQLAKALNTPLDKTKSVNSWGDVLSVALTRMASKLTTAGVTALTNEVNRQKNIANGTYSGLGGNILAKTSTTDNNSGATEILDLEAFFLGDPVQKVKKDAQGKPVYEPVIDQSTGEPKKDAAGNIVYDTNKPIYEYEQLRDADGKLVFETKEVEIKGSIPPKAVSVNVPVYDYTKPIYEKGYDLKYEGGSPLMEETPSEDHELVEIAATKASDGVVKLAISSKVIDLSKRSISWEDLRTNQVIAIGRDKQAIEVPLSCKVGGCHDSYSVKITKSDGTTIQKFAAVWRNLTINGVDWKTELGGKSDALPSTGELVIDTTIPLYEKDELGNIIYESKVDANGQIIKDANGLPIPDTTKPKQKSLRRGGALARVYYMNWILAKERELIRQLPQAAKALDQCIPGPDYGWDKRLQARYDRYTQKYGGKKPEQVNHLLTPLKEIGQAVYTIMSSYEEGNPPAGCTGTKWVEPTDQSRITISGEKVDANKVKITLSSSTIDLANSTKISWKYINWGTNVEDKQDDGVASIEKVLKCPASGCHDIYRADIQLQNGTFIYKKISIWRVYENGDLINPVWKYNTSEGWSEGANIPIGQSIYNLTGNPNVGIDCGGPKWQDYTDGKHGTDAGYTWGYLDLNMQTAQNLAGYELDDTGKIVLDTKGFPKKILNIPSATASREVFDSMKTKYSRMYKQVAEKQSEMLGIKRNLDKLYQEYYNGTRDVNLIARDVAALREDLPYDASIQREKLSLVQIGEDISKIYETTSTCYQEKADPKYYDIYFKDVMQVLYCPLQFHGKINTASREDKTFQNFELDGSRGPDTNYKKMRDDIISVIGGKTQKDIRETLQSSGFGRAILWTYRISTLGLSDLLLGANDAASNTTMEKYLSWLRHPRPNNDGNGGQGGSHPLESEYMCWETGYEEAENAGEAGADKKLGKNNGNVQGAECIGQSNYKEQGNPEGNGKFAVERLPLLCKDFYKSALSDYNELFGITQNSTLP